MELMINERSKAYSNGKKCDRIDGHEQIGEKPFWVMKFEVEKHIRCLTKNMRKKIAL